MKFRTAILQMRSSAGDILKNTDTVTAKMQEAAENGADILLLPECFLTGYNVMPISNPEALTRDSHYIKKIRDTAADLNIGVVATAFTHGEMKPRNTALVIDKLGKVIMQYDKVHTCDFADEACLESGKEFRVCDFHGVKLGIMICYDREYPESARILMLKGAEIILVPNDCYSMAPRVRALSTRAYENMTGIAMANPNGKNAGCSCAFSPICWNSEDICIDNTLVMADELTEGLYYADFDMEALREYREREMLGNTFRKTQTYSDLIDGSVNPPFIRARKYV